LKTLLTKQSDNFARINPADAEALGIHDGELVEVATNSGQIHMRARLDEALRCSVISIPHGWGRILFHPDTKQHPERQGVNVNVLTDDRMLDLFTGMPVYNAIPCSVRRVAEKENR
jgi:anaerobic selenocysteine-containing dehydrogenase